MVFKSFAEILQPDFRHSFQLAGDETEPWRKIEFADHYAIAAAIELPGHVSEDVRQMFDRARHAFVFAWFDYELTVLADQYTLATLEAALKAHYGPTGPRTLAPLIRRALDDGLFDPGLDFGGLRATSLSHIRNHWAHGVNGFGSPLTTSNLMRLCARLIGTLTT